MLSDAWEQLPSLRLLRTVAVHLERSQLVHVTHAHARIEV
jgi:hypothetical protein